MDTTAVWVAAMGFFGLIVTSLFTYAGQRAAAKDARDAAKEAATAAREARDSSLAQGTKVEEIHTLVNDKSDKQAAIIAGLTIKIEELHQAALARAESSPATGTAAPVTATIPVKVVVVDTEKPIDVIDKTPPKEN